MYCIIKSVDIRTGDMLIQSSHPSSRNTELFFASDNGLLCDWSCCSKTWKMSPKCDGCPWDSCRESISTAEEENKSSTNLVDISRTCSDISILSNMCTGTTLKMDGLVYKRRKLHRNSITHLSRENFSANAKGSFGCRSSISSEEQLLLAKKDEVCKENHLQKPASVFSPNITNTRSLESVPKFVPDDSYSFREKVTALEHRLSVNDRCSSSKSDTGNGSGPLRTEMDTGECSSSDIITAEPLMEFTSAKELCISVLRNYGLLGGVWGSSEHALTDALNDQDVDLLQSCKVCSVLENPRKMLICDICDDAYHLSCCKPRVKKLPVDGWYCQPCFRSKPKLFLENSTRKSSKIMGEASEYRKRISHGDLGPIAFMLKDTEPYTSGVRIGKDFQVEVPVWSGTTFDENYYFGELLELKPVECASMNVCNSGKPYEPSSIGNWIQCREVLYNGSNEPDEGTVCGKWRRAPLFVVQTDDWDCSCSVLWDPSHADCAVPQELETEVVLKHLKYIKLLRPRLANRKRNPVKRGMLAPNRRL